ncbi:calcium/sodium antiporter [Alkalimarinus sediminis]|uniref:Calcium/sodium antiporter n=1 Tax=Alkalimarinus sediminis TaxID=1632866 RepID=A0A9E8HHJ8_9ALTE|nr:calcium/sodium antiporter [Alkalimarinus sediminis]UZW73482.1 calcium/sodium antiporter [Alkalimarinus sediminis]
MILFFTGIIVGLIVLVLSADRFVNGSVATARNLGMSPMLIGLTIVAFGTSAPEMIVSGTAALADSSSLAVGNAIGSNIANIALVLGITALVSPIPLKAVVLKREFPVLLAATLAVTVLFLDNHLGVWDGVIMVVILAISMYFLTRNNLDAPELIDEVAEVPATSTPKAVIELVVSLALLLASSKLLVWGASGVAREMGVSELIIGLTIVAIGTSLPELAASVASALKGHHDIALGNIIGSNLFNLLAVLPIPALLNPVNLDGEVLLRDYSIMLGLTIFLAASAYIMQKKGHLGRVLGGFLLATYLGYLVLLYLSVNVQI